MISNLKGKKDPMGIDLMECCSGDAKIKTDKVESLGPEA
jgi:hypothetical protein